MTLPKHTPTPWRIGRKQNAQINLVAGDGSVSLAFVNTSQSYMPDGEANAARIVHCVNMFDEMIALIEELIEALHLSHGREFPDHDPDTCEQFTCALARKVLAQSSAMLAKAKDTP